MKEEPSCEQVKTDPHFVSVQADRKTDRHPDRHPDRHQDRHLDRHPDRHLDRHPDRHPDRLTRSLAWSEMSSHSGLTNSYLPSMMLRSNTSCFRCQKGGNPAKLTVGRKRRERREDT